MIKFGDKKMLNCKIGAKQVWKIKVGDDVVWTKPFAMAWRAGGWGNEIGIPNGINTVFPVEFSANTIAKFDVYDRTKTIKIWSNIQTGFSYSGNFNSNTFWFTRGSGSPYLPVEYYYAVFRFYDTSGNLLYDSESYSLFYAPAGKGEALPDPLPQPPDD